MGRPPRWPLAHAEQPHGPLLLEFQSTRRRCRDAPDPPAEFGDLGPHPRLSQHPHAERQCGRADIQAALDIQGECYRSEILVLKSPVSRAVTSPGRRRPAAPWPRLADRGEQPKELAVAEHPGGSAQPLRGLSDPHGSNLTFFC